MASNVDTATELMTLAGGPSTLGTAAIYAWTQATLRNTNRDPARGWTALGASLLLAGWLIVFVVLAIPTVVASWDNSGDPNPTLILLSATWLVALPLIVIAAKLTLSAVRYLDEAYRVDEGPWLIRQLRRVLR